MQPPIPTGVPSQEQKRDGFEIVSGNLELVELTKMLFDQIIKPLYGDQTTAIDRIEKGVDRTTKLLFDGGQEVGILVIKNRPNSEFADVEADNAIEIKTLFVIGADNRPRQGTGTKLITEAIKMATDAGADHLAVTVSATKTESLGFFQKHGFEIKQDMPDKYIKGVTEHLLIKKLK